VILSEASLASEWVEFEVRDALAREAAGNAARVIFPVRIDDAALSADNDWLREIRSAVHIGDFSEWREPTAYERGLRRLLGDLAIAVGATDSVGSRRSASILPTR
jgi:hypothetical protein